MIRLLISFFIFIFTFSYSAEVCEIQKVPDTSYSPPAWSDGHQYCSQLPSGTNGWMNCLRNPTTKNNGNGTYTRCAEHAYFNGQANTNLGTRCESTSHKYPLIDKEICHFVDDRLPTWEDCTSGKGSVSYTKKMTIKLGDTNHVTANRYTAYYCDQPDLYFEILHPKKENQTDEEYEQDSDFICTGNLCNGTNGKDIAESIDEVPCFGGNCNPNSEQGEHYQGEYDGVPCFANNPQACNNWSPDYINQNGVPCWGNYCPTDGKAPIYQNENGQTCVGPYCEGSNGHLSDGTSVNNGSTGGNGGTGGNNGTGEDDFGIGGAVGGLPNLTDSMPIVPDSFWKRKHANESIESLYDDNLSQSIPNFSNFDTSLGVTGFCPVFEFPYIGNISPPCWAWDLIKAFFYFCSAFFSFMIVFVRSK